MIHGGTVVPIETIMLIGMPCVSFFTALGGAYVAIKVSLATYKTEITGLRADVDHMRALLEGYLMSQIKGGQNNGP